MSDCIGYQKLSLDLLIKYILLPFDCIPFICRFPLYVIAFLSFADVFCIHLQSNHFFNNWKFRLKMTSFPSSARSSIPCHNQPVAHSTLKIVFSLNVPIKQTHNRLAKRTTNIFDTIIGNPKTGFYSMFSVKNACIHHKWLWWLVERCNLEFCIDLILFPKIFWDLLLYVVFDGIFIFNLTASLTHNFLNRVLLSPASQAERGI